MAKKTKAKSTTSTASSWWEERKKIGKSIASAWEVMGVLIMGILFFASFLYILLKVDIRLIPDILGRDIILLVLGIMLVPIDLLGIFCGLYLIFRALMGIIRKEKEKVTFSTAVRLVKDVFNVKTIKYATFGAIYFGFLGYISADLGVDRGGTAIVWAFLGAFFGVLGVFDKDKGID